MAQSKYILALDQGTTSSRALLFDRAGHIAGRAQREFRQHFPAPGEVEHDAHEIWTSQSDVMLEAVSAAGATAADIAGIGIANQRETTVIWERATGEPIHPAIVWQDRRTTPICEALRRNGHEDMIRRKTGLVADPYFSGTKVQWMLDQVDGARARAARGELAFGTIDSWLIWKLTEGGRHVTDASNASRTLLYNVRERTWDDELLEVLRVPREVLPDIVPSSGVLGRAAPGSPLAGVAIAGVAGDQQAALFGQACFDPGMAKNTYGTGCFLLWQTGSECVASENRLLTTVAWQEAGGTHYALEGSVFIAGAVVQWLRDGLGLFRHAAEVEALAASVTDSGGVILVPAFAGLGAPHWDPYARGTLVGITRGTTRAHLARAALEAIAFQSADLLSAMEADTGQALTELRVDGGASVNDLLMQFQADVLGVTVVRPEVVETTALGAAYLAGLATGFWGGHEEIARQWREGRRFVPAMDPDQAATLRERWSRAVKRSQCWVTDDA